MPVTPPPTDAPKRLREDDLPSDANLGESSMDRKRKRLTNASYIWEHFRKSEDKKSIVCLHCHPEGSTRFAYSGGTSTMNRHLRRKHAIYAPGKTAEDYENNDTFLRYSPPPVLDVSPALDKSVTDDGKVPARPSKQSMVQTQQWIHYVVAQYAPFELDADLAQLLKSRTTGAFQALQGPALVATLRDATFSLRNQLHTYLVSMRPKLSLSIDSWEVVPGIVLYVATAHWVTDAFERRQCALDVSLLGSDKPFELWFQEVLDTYGLEAQLVAVTLGRDCPVAALQAAFPSLVFVPCILHQLETIVRSILEAAGDVLHRCRELVVRHPRHGVALDAPLTSWWSTCEMVSQLVAGEAVWKDELSPDDWATLKDLADVLVPLQSLLQNCLLESSVLVPLASLVFAMLHGIAKRLLGFKSPIQKALSAAVHALLKHAPPLLHVVCALDPRFKTLPFLSPNEKHAAFVTLSASMEKPATPETDPVALPKKGSKESLMLAWSEMYPFEDAAGAPLQATVQTYLDAATSLTAAASLVDPLAWWKVNVHVFGDMAGLAKSYLSVSPFCMPVQDVLQPALRARKTRIPSHLVDVVLFLRSALHVPELQDHKHVSVPAGSVIL
ncbi:hypothetical protein ACHHYP_06643 [Achlya hypogyna]|uniref:BED-type domain-containing protein n=1 Tax=Achlya hypogyna TaxID=1202772 RepID=A0A1V9YSW5_ACHHY|nr:hypothetical protein ACHHYP_06643 [Achlya hypogyna]